MFKNSHQCEKKYHKMFVCVRKNPQICGKLVKEFKKCMKKRGTLGAK